MKDRVPGKPNRKKITYADGRVEYATVERADEPIEQGTPLSKATLLTDATATKLGLDPATATPDMAFGATYTSYSIGTVGPAPTFLAPMSPKRTDFATGANPQGDVLFAGGYTDGNDGSLNDQYTVEKYDAYGNKTLLQALCRSRSRLAAATDGAGNVLFCGGLIHAYDNAYSAEVDKYDLKGVRSSCDNLSIGRYSAAASTDGLGNVIVGGGNKGGDNETTSVDKYNYLGKRTSIAPLRVGRTGMAAATDGAGNVLFGGGTRIYDGSRYRDVDKYDTAGVRTSLTPLTEPPGTGFAIKNNDGCVLFFRSNGNIDRYDVNGVKSIGTPLLAPPGSTGAALNADGDIIILNHTKAYKYSASEQVTNLIGPPSGYYSASRSAAKNGNGNIIFGSPRAEGVCRYSAAPLSIWLPLGAKYKFKDDTIEKTYTNTDNMPLSIPTPNTGYVRMGGAVTI